MNSTSSLPPVRRVATVAARRQEILAAFDKSGLSGAEFARQNQISYTTFSNWRQERERNKRGISFAQVEVDKPAGEPGLIIELGRHARMRLESSAQLDLAVGLLQRLQGAC